MSASTPVEIETRRLAAWQTATVVLLFSGYAGYYFCRSDLSVAMPLIIDELKHNGFTSSDAVIKLGAISSYGVLAYALGKMFLGGIADFWGGRSNFLLGMAGSILFTILFALTGAVPIFTIAWIGNRLLQSMGWAGLVKVSSKWFSYSAYGRVIGILSISYLVGDAVARQMMGSMIQHGYGWRALFYLAAGVLTVIFIANLIFLREARNRFGFSEPLVNPLNLYSANKSQSAPASVGALLMPLLSNRTFWVVCLLSLGCTLVRETFNIWTPTYFKEALKYSSAAAGGTSAVFPAVGIVSIMLSGWIGDRLGANGRPLVMFAGLSATVVALLALMSVGGSNAGKLPVVLVGIVALGLLGPYSYLGGAMALDFGGRQGGAVSSGLIDGIGYLGGVLAGDSVARISVNYGWRGVFFALALVSALSAGGAGYLYLCLRRKLGDSR